MNKEELHQLLHPMKVIGLGGNPALNEKIASILHQPLIETAVHHFSDGEIQVNIGESVRGCDVFVIQSVQDPVNENFMELEIVLDALHRASAHTINVVAPYLAYSRSDTKTRSREPITAKLVANLLQLTGMDRLITVDLHASQIQGFYNIPVDHLHAIPLLGQYFLDNGIATKEDDDIVVVSPDHSGAKLARNFGQYFNAPIAIVDQRGARYDTEVHDIIGDVKDKKCIIVDDLVDTGSRISSSTKSVLAAGAKKVYVAATHALLSKNATEVLNELPIEQIVVTDTIKHTRYPDRMVRISVDQLLARGIDYVYNDRSIHQIFDEQNRLK
ncbi:ribose-phosphate diphosphokinase [Lactobacillus amylovorus]|jgi:ribose-phosphate pyrophosphokinase|uniref:Ribose-phosphate pyrophosphokinase n=1 Tax=Lactobacillus amylovorus subsp. animalium TaxID=3378536 RepID=A0ABD0BZI5_LACAM|nr:ribose-phosphate diphosphokinase [Lactobacillus amylovorus]HBQ08259.1 ribose-phosphate pyrophosphokinase [Lactobacillus sp.]MCT3596016.1 ribose-phosphate diphosphokinase [Lactobacillus amylovorus]MDB6225204.1 ribose-phosphate diphosphokinase [Lactobacillus amylovorus]MDB6228190.1 ribose-phosphate diphosphokinase [Lactobacillus amylovorus]TJY03677.1 ribose-phosphate diphosphokinase [Lactobacillus amylovorus]